MRCLHLLSAALLLTTTYAQDAPIPSWVRTMGGNGLDRGAAIAIDATGHVLLTGSFTSTVDFDPGPEVASLTTAGGNDIYVAKYTADGEYVWARRMGGLHSDVPLAIATDAQGNVYTTGGFCGTADFDPGPGTFNMTAATTGQADIFVSKLDADGNFVWAKGIVGGTWWDQGYGIEIDPQGNVVVAGRFYFQGGPRDFDPGPDTFLLTAGHEDIFVLKLDNDGNFLWAVNFGTSPHESRAHSVVVDEAGNIYTTGYFRGAVDFDPGPGTQTLTAVGTWNVFCHKLDPNGNFVWVRSLPITTTTYHTEPRGYGRKLALDGSGHLLATGRFSGTIDFDPGAGNFPMTAVGDHDCYVLKLTTDGEFVWARAVGGEGYDEGFGIAADAQGNVHVVGTFVGTADLDPGAETFTVQSLGSDDMFFLSLAANGDFIQAGSMGGADSDQANAIALDAGGVPHITGWFRATADLHPGTDTLSVASAGNADIFVLKLGGSNVGISEGDALSRVELRLFPNPARHMVVVTMDGLLHAGYVQVRIFDATGRMVHVAGTNNGMRPYSMPLPEHLKAGLYLLAVHVDGVHAASARLVLE